MLKKRTLITAIIIILAAFAVISVIYLNRTKTIATDENTEFGTEIAEIKEETASDKILEAGDLTFSEEELTDFQQIRETSSLLENSDESVEDVVDDFIEEEAMYEKAVEEGYEATDEDFEAYKDEIRTSLEQAENKEEMMGFFESFGGIEGYFDAMENQLRKSLSTRKYLDSLMNEYANETQQNVSDPEFAGKWIEKEEQIKQDIAEEANVSEKEKEALVDVIE